MKLKEFLQFIMGLVVLMVLSNLPEEAIWYTTLIISLYCGYKTILRIYQKKYCDEIMTMALTGIWFLVASIHGYIVTNHSTSDLDLITLLIMLWLFPVFIYTFIATRKRLKDFYLHKLRLLLLYYSIAVCVGFTVIFIWF